MGSGPLLSHLIPSPLRGEGYEHRDVRGRVTQEAKAEDEGYATQLHIKVLF